MSSDNAAMDLPTLTGAVATLRPLVPEDAAALHRHADDPDVAGTLFDGFPQPYSMAEAQAWCNDGWRSRGLVWAIVAGGEFVGCMGLRQDAGWLRCNAEVGYWIGKAHWGRGITSESLRLATEWSFAHLADITRIYAPIFDWNERSQGVARKAGYVFEGAMPQSAIKDGRLIGRVVYAKYREGAAESGDAHAVTSLAQLQSLFGAVGEASMRKEVGFIHPAYRRWIEASPFAVLATAGPQGLDTSPRGDPVGFAVVEDEHTLLVPERRGNNRIDSLRNLLTDPRVSLIFLIPGVGETLRVQGRATISTDPARMQRLTMDGKLPQCVVVVEVESVFFQCARAMQRSGLWAGRSRPDGVPTAGELLQALTQGGIDGAQYDAELPERQRRTLY